MFQIANGLYSQCMKQDIVVRSDLKMSIGKMMAQACHASVAAVLSSPTDTLERWTSDGQTKIVLQASSLSELINLKQQCDAMPLVHGLISDAGYTELAPGTVTALAIGPAEEKLIDTITGSLPLL